MANSEQDLQRRLKRLYSAQPRVDLPQNPLAAKPASRDEVAHHLRSVRTGSDVTCSDASVSHLLRELATLPADPDSQPFDQVDLITPQNEEYLAEKLALDPEKHSDRDELPIELSRVVFYGLNETDEKAAIYTREEHKKKELIEAMQAFVGWTWTKEQTRAVLFPKGHSDWKRISNLIKTLSYLRSKQPPTDRFHFSITVECVDDEGFLEYEGKLHRFPDNFKTDRSCQILLTLVMNFQQLEKKAKKSQLRGKRDPKRARR